MRKYEVDYKSITNYWLQKKKYLIWFNIKFISHKHLAYN